MLGKISLQGIFYRCLVCFSDLYHSFCVGLLHDLIFSSRFSSLFLLIQVISTTLITVKIGHHYKFIQSFGLTFLTVFIGPFLSNLIISGKIQYYKYVEQITVFTLGWLLTYIIGKHFRYKHIKTNMSLTYKVFYFLLGVVQVRKLFSGYEIGEKLHFSLSGRILLSTILSLSECFLWEVLNITDVEKYGGYAIVEFVILMLLYNFISSSVLSSEVKKISFLLVYLLTPLKRISLQVSMSRKYRSVYNNKQNKEF